MPDMTFLLPRALSDEPLSKEKQDYTRADGYEHPGFWVDDYSHTS